MFRYVFGLLIILNVMVFGTDFFVSSDAFALKNNEAPKKPVKRIELAEKQKKSVLVSTDNQEQPVCYMLGPFLDQNIAQDLMHHMRRKGIKTVQEMREQIQKQRYLVYIPALSSMAVALKAQQDLENNSIVETQIIREGKHRGTITIGLFDERVHAERKMEFIRYLGYDAKITLRKPTKKVYWLNYALPSPSLNEAIKKWLKALPIHNQIRRMVQRCR